MGVQKLEQSLKEIFDKKINEEARARRGIIKNGRLQIGAKSYPYQQAVDCNINGKVWAQIADNGKAVIVGA